MKKLFLFLSVGIILFSACSSSNNNPTPSGNTTLTNGRWKITSSVSSIDYGSGTGVMTYDLYSSLPACQQDNQFIFNTDGTTTTDEGSVKCNSTDPQQTASGTWQLLNNNTQMKIVGVNGGTSIDVTADVLKLTSDSLAVHYNTDYGGYPASTTTRYVHIP